MTQCTDPLGSLVPATFGRDACLVSGFISKELIRSCLIVSSATIERIRVGATAKMVRVVRVFAVHAGS